MARVDLSADVLGDDEPEPAPEAPPRRRQSGRRTKYTIELSERDTKRAERVTADVVKRSRVRPTKQMRGDVIRLLFAQADEDPALRARLAERLRAVEERRRDTEV